ncbi:hypothetical protein GSI_04062 [Ganoderma sinense ZZ0214-1]|uniref:Fungal-type protein kinase domain-containing protein n=1 Tax=Ganoderma sinense ZZ0214-1 TaxID=1077348 RepID=A0A2G8SI57_9APHY|nr:hypothetical protein GSI_04062 [Ganoderma sinense ZZ0214-1]
MPPRSVSFAEGTLQHSDSPGRYNRANAPASNTLPNLEENRAELRCNMHGKITLLPVKTFLETFFPSIDIEEPAQPNIFHNMKTPTSERQMYEDLDAERRRYHLEVHVRRDPLQSDQADPSKQSVDCGMYLNEDTPEPENGAVYARVDWSNLDLSIECKCHPTDQDPLDDAKGDGEPTADKRQEALGQILSYAELVFRYQHRMFHFMILFLGTEARIVRFDRSGIFATHKFSLKEEGHWLVEFLCAYTALSPVERGYDPTVTRVVRGSAAWKAMKQKADTVDDKDQRDYVRELFKSSLDEEWPWWLIEVHPEPSRSSKRQVKRRYLVGKPHFQAPGVAGRGTRGYVALPANAKGQPLKSGKFVYLKDAWRVDYPDIDQEGKTLEFLNDNKVPYIPTLVVHGDVPNQVTQSQDLWPQFHPGVRACPLKRHTHYRLVVAEVGKPLDAFGDNSWELITALMCCIQAHERAYRAGIIHRDISSGNLLLYQRDDGFWYGLLNDWELCKKMEPSSVKGRQPDRTGTWQFMSAHALNSPFRKIVIQDELESFFHVLIYHAVRFLPHNLQTEDVGKFLHDYFDAAGTNSSGYYCCGKAKKTVMKHGAIDISEYNGDHDVENTTLRFLWPSPKPVAPSQQEELGTPSERSSPPPSRSSPPASPSYVAIFDPHLTPLPSECTPPPDDDYEINDDPELAPEEPEKDHPMNHIIDELLSWFKAYYSFDVAPRPRVMSGNVVPTGGMIPMQFRQAQVINRPKSDQAIGERARASATAAADSSSADRVREAKKRAEEEEALQRNKELSAKLESHDAILQLFGAALEKMWPAGDKQADKKPPKGYVRPKRHFPQGSTTSRTASKRPAGDEAAGDVSDHKPSKRSRP